MNARPAWLPDWAGQACAIIGAGASASRDLCERLRGRARIIVVNRSFELAPWADILYGCDAKFWKAYPAARLFAGLKLCEEKRFCREHEWLTPIDVARDGSGRLIDQLVMEPGRLGAGGSNGGFQAFNLAVQTGARPLLISGLDYCGEHWHGPHRTGNLSNPTPERLALGARILDAQAPRLKAMGIEVFNLSAVSVLAAYPKTTLEEALN